MNDETKLKEHGEGFLSREKIARTPPEEDARRAQVQYGNSSLGQYYNDGNGSMGSQQYGVQDYYPAPGGSGKKAASYKLGKGVSLGIE